MVLFQAGRFDALYCVQVESAVEYSNVSYNSEKKAPGSKSVVYTLMKEFYAPVLMNDFVRPLVVVFFVGWWALCGCLVPRIEIGLDQEVSMPSVRCPPSFQFSIIHTYPQLYHLVILYYGEITSVAGKCLMNFVAD